MTTKYYVMKAVSVNKDNEKKMDRTIYDTRKALMVTGNLTEARAYFNKLLDKANDDIKSGKTPEFENIMLGCESFINPATPLIASRLFSKSTVDSGQSGIQSLLETYRSVSGEIKVSYHVGDYMVLNEDGKRAMIHADTIEVITGQHGKLLGEFINCINSNGKETQRFSAVKSDRRIHDGRFVSTSHRLIEG